MSIDSGCLQVVIETTEAILAASKETLDPHDRLVLRAGFYKLVKKLIENLPGGDNGNESVVK